MYSPAETVSTVARGGVVPVVRLPTLDKAVELADALLAGGVTAIELTMTSPGAMAALTILLDAIPGFRTGEAALGLGTVIDSEQARAAIDAGAQFIVSPAFEAEVVSHCVAARVAVMPGALTPTEIQTAWQAGASVVKVFPARAFGPAYFKDLLAPLPHLQLMPTGGVDLENAPSFVRNGAVAVGVGSNLVDGELIAASRWDELSARARAFVEAVASARSL